VDLFTGAPVPQGKRSLTFSIEYQNPSRTLTAEEADAIHQRVVQALVTQHGAVLR
jgi:phenylalanyl-tRNA synthetase beta chain